MHNFILYQQGLDAAKMCSNAAHRAVRLGNPLVALSRLDRDDFAAIFEGNVRFEIDRSNQSAWCGDLCSASCSAQWVLSISSG